MSVDVVYNPYRVTTSISVDGKPISINSVLANYQTIEMVNWGGRFFEDIRITANDNYSMNFYAPGPECRIMKRLAKDSVCSKLSLFQPKDIPDTTLERLETLSEIIGAANAPIMVHASFDVYSDFSDEVIHKLFAPLTPNLCFVTWHMETKQMAEFDPDSENPYFVICSDKRKASRMRIGETESHGCILSISDNRSFEYNGYYFVESVTDKVELENCLLDYMDLLVWERLLRDGLSQVHFEHNSKYSDVLFLLDKIEPTPFIKLPETIELGTEYKIQPNMLPAGTALCTCTVQTSDVRVISVSDMKLCAHANGKAMVRVYYNNAPTPIVSRYIQVEKRNRISSIDFNIPAAIRVGDEYDIDVEYEPSNADNANEIMFLSSDQYIADVEKKGTVLGVNAGVATITVAAGKVAKEKQIRIFPRLKKLIWDVASTEVLENTAISATLTREPKDATLDKVRISVYPSSAGVYDERTALLQVNHPGLLTLTAQTADGKVSENVYLEVKERKKNKGIPSWLMMILVILGLWLLSKIFPFTRS